MKFFNRLESKFSKYAIKGLMRYFLVLYVIGYVIFLIDANIYYQLFALDMSKILQGQVWRLISWLFYPPSTSIFWGLLMILVYYNLANVLEYIWGSFKFNVFMFMGIIFHILAAIVMHLYLLGSGYPMELFQNAFWYLTPVNLNLSIFLAYAMTFPDAVFQLYIVFPIKARYLAVFYIVMELYTFYRGTPAIRVSIVLSLLNVFIFYLLSRKSIRVVKNPIFTSTRQVYSGNTSAGAEGTRPGEAVIKPMTAMHRCHICGKTELDDENMEFRYCSKCNGSYEYCRDHLHNHEHIE